MNTMNTRLGCCVTLALALASLVAALLLFLPRTRLTVVRSEHRKLWAVLVAGSKGEFKILPKLPPFKLYYVKAKPPTPVCMPPGSH